MGSGGTEVRPNDGVPQHLDEWEERLWRRNTAGSPEWPAFASRQNVMQLIRTVSTERSNRQQAERLLEAKARQLYDRIIRALVIQREHCREQAMLAHRQGSYLRETHWASLSQGTAHAIEEAYRLGLATFTPEPDPPPPAGMTEWPSEAILQREANELRQEANRVAALASTMKVSEEQAAENLAREREQYFDPNPVSRVLRWGK